MANKSTTTLPSLLKSSPSESSPMSATTTKPQPIYGPTDIKQSVLELIGNTPLLALDRLWPGPGRLLAKCEFLNPAGSIKDRSAAAMIHYATESGRLESGAPLIEVSSGNQGCGLSMVAAVTGHPCTIVMSAGNSRQRTEMITGLGGRCHRVPQVQGVPGSVTHADGEACMEYAESLRAANPALFYVNQDANPDNCRAHEEHTGPEIYRQTGGRVDAFLALMGTGGSFVGISRYLKRKKPTVHCVVVEPEGAEVIAGKPVTKPLHLLQGGGYGVVPELFDDRSLADGTIAVTDDEAVATRQLLGTKEGLYVGFSSGANVAAALRLLRSGALPPDSWVVTLLPDSGLKYSEMN